MNYNPYLRIDNSKARDNVSVKQYYRISKHKDME